MGADLYIEMVFEPSYRRWKNRFEEAVARRDACAEGTPEYKLWWLRAEACSDRMYSAGYFRDSYNPSSLLWQFGLSWWKDVIPMLDERNNLTVAQAETLLEMLDERGPVFEKKLAQFSPDEQQDFRDRATELQMFLQMAIKLDSPIHCSL